MTPEWRAVVDNFRDAATRFIKVVDSRNELTCEQLLECVEICLTELHMSALRLPVVAPETGGVDSPTCSTGAGAALYSQLREKFGKSDHYWSVFNSTEQGPPVDGSLAGDISEIYEDLKDSLHEASQNVADADILWDLRFSFASHWGRHLTSALKAIFDLRSNGTLG